ATFALNAGLWFRRGRLAMVFSSLAASCCCCAENPLIPAVQISGTTSNSVRRKRDTSWIKYPNRSSPSLWRMAASLTSLGP
ncbi:MAG: hypothetical protein Q8K20_20645, partial [Gemmobacter sp.]|nr:hypothetical protein [Gemmobacter sp.]